MATFSYSTSFYPLVYNAEKEFFELVSSPFGDMSLLRYPDPAPDQDLEFHLNKMGREGWELISVQPFFGPKKERQGGEVYGLFTSAQVNTSYETQELMGYIYYWKKPLEDNM